MSTTPLPSTSSHRIDEDRTSQPMTTPIIPPSTNRSTEPTQGGGASPIYPGAAAVIGVAVSLVVIAVIISVIVCFVFCKWRARQGFYQTNESNDNEASLGHFNTSLKTHSAEPVPANNSHHNWSVKNGSSSNSSGGGGGNSSGGYSNGGPPPAYSTSKANNMHYSTREKEFYL